MDVETFKRMMSMITYQRIDRTKFKNATELRNFKAQGMPDVSSKEPLLSVPESLKDKINQLVTKGNFFGASSKTNKNKPGNIIYKGDHVWTLIGEKNERFMFLMTKIDDSQCKMEYLGCFEDKDKDKYLTFFG